MVRLPSSTSGPTDDAEPRVLGLETEAAGDVLSALCSGTARKVFSTIHDEPATSSKVADLVGTSVQNAQYHLEKLTDAGAVDVVDTKYSEKGRQMKLYAPANKPIVVCAGSDEEQKRLERMIEESRTGVDIL